MLSGLKTPVIRPLRWMGDSKKNLMKFPNEAKHSIGSQLQFIQYGGMPKDAKPLKGFGSGVFEIAIKHNKEEYRTVFAVQLGNYIYVLHAFHKKSKKGISTPKGDLALIKQRLSEAKELARDD